MPEPRCGQWLADCGWQLSVAAIRGEHVNELLHEGEPGIAALIARFSRDVAVGLADLVYVLDPQVFVLGGGLVELGEVLRSNIESSLADRILVKREEPNETVRGGIIIPDTAKEKPQEGRVVAVGPGKVDEDGKRTPLELKKGDRILMGKYAGTEVKIDDVEHLIMREDDVLAVIE